MLQLVKRTLWPPEKHNLTALPLTSSPLHPVTLPDAARLKAGIPATAAFYSFCYPATKSVHRLTKLAVLAREGVDLRDPFVQWLRCGAFLYFDFKCASLPPRYPIRVCRSAERAPD